MASRDRRDRVLDALTRLASLPEGPPLVLVDNGSRDGTPEAVTAALPRVDVVRTGRNLGGAARTVGAERLATPFVAFADDDTWWSPGALRRAATVLEGAPDLGGVAARVLVGAGRRLDPVCEAMAASPLPRRPGWPGPGVLGFVACGVVLRRDAFLAAGGFHPRYGIGGEEELLALDLAAGGLGIAYDPGLVAIHDPAPSRDPARRRRVQARNAVWTAWLRREPAAAGRATAGAVRAAARDRAAAAGLADAVRGGRWVLGERRVVPADVRAAARAVERSGA
jgi:GT2 family glycosyltransferase